MPAHRDAPADFAVMAETLKNPELRRHYQANSTTIARWRKETGAKRHLTHDRRAPPADFATRAVATHDAALKALYRASIRTIKRWRDDTNARHARQTSLSIPPPETFVALAPTMSRNAAIMFFKRGGPTIDRWAAEAGVVFIKKTPARGRGERIPLDRCQRDMSLSGRAADHLRRLGPVYRCRPNGAADARGKMWSRGGFVLTDAEIIDRAKRQGWKPDEWRSVRPHPTSEGERA